MCSVAVVCFQVVAQEVSVVQWENSRCSYGDFRGPQLVLQGLWFSRYFATPLRENILFLGYHCWFISPLHGLTG